MSIVLRTVLCILLLPAAASAQLSAQDREMAARGWFVQGRAAYEQGDFETAHVDFGRAYELSQSPKLLYNIGLAAQKLGLVTEALTAYDAYLAWGQGERAEEVRGRVAALRDLSERDAAFASPASVAAAASQSASSALVAQAVPAARGGVSELSQETQQGSARRWWPWAVAGGVVAVIVSVAIAVPLAKRDNDSELKPNTGLVVRALHWGGE